LPIKEEFTNSLSSKDFKNSVVDPRSIEANKQLTIDREELDKHYQKNISSTSGLDIIPEASDRQ
jgi:hypothetical protein